MLVECEGEGENALDLSGDVGAVGRFSVLKKPGGDGDNMFLDLKGVMYRATIVPSTTFMVVNLGPTEAKVGGRTDSKRIVATWLNLSGDQITDLTPLNVFSWGHLKGVSDLTSLMSWFRSNAGALVSNAIGSRLGRSTVD